MTFGGGIFNVVSLKYIGMILINVGEMCFIPMNIHNERFNGVRQLILSLSVRLSLSLSVVPHPVFLISGL